MFWCVVVLTFASSVRSAVYTELTSICSLDEFTCGDGACVTRESRCDGVQHCADNSDEEDCWKDSNKLDLSEIILNRHKRQSTCGKGDYRCRDGTCVRFDQKCDGEANCPDGSDETHALCRNMRCQGNLFRCTYGACVDGTAPCNGVKECVDNSDELLPRCRKEPEEVRGQFKCKSGETISSIDHCDGVANCRDGSDETIESCAGKRCQSFLFQCAYGACVDNGADCDGKIDCVDGSDESDELCNRTTISTTYRPIGSCVLPDYPEHGKYTVNKQPFAKPGQSYNMAVLTVTCDPGYGVVGSNTTYCFSEYGWSRPVPQCSRFCKLTPHPSVDYYCKVTGDDQLKGTRLCHEYEPSGTVVIPECKRPNYYHNGFLANMYCIDGSWDSVTICQPGTTNVGSKVTIVFNNNIYVHITGTDYSVSIGDTVVHANHNVTLLLPVSQLSPVTSKPVTSPTVSTVKPSTMTVASTASPVKAKPSTPVPSTGVPIIDHNASLFPSVEASTPDVVSPVSAVTPVESETYYDDYIDESWWRIGSSS